MKKFNFKEAGIAGFSTKYFSVKAKKNTSLNTDDEEGMEFILESKLVILLTAVTVDTNAGLTEEYEGEIEKPNHEVLQVPIADRERLFGAYEIGLDEDVVEELLKKDDFVLSVHEALELEEEMIILKELAIKVCKIHRLQLRHKFFKHYHEKMVDGKNLLESAEKELDDFLASVDLARRVKGRNAVSRVVDQIIA